MTSHTTSQNNTHKIQILHYVSHCFCFLYFYLVIFGWLMSFAQAPIVCNYRLTNKLGFQGTQNCPPKAMVGYDLNEKGWHVGTGCLPPKNPSEKSRKIRGFWRKYLAKPSFGVILVVDMHQMTHEFWSLFGPSSGIEQVVWGRRKTVKNRKHVPYTSEDLSRRNVDV